MTVSTLTELYNQTMTRQEESRLRRAEEEAAKRRALEEQGIALLKEDLNRWRPLRTLLGLQGEPTIQGTQAIILGQTQINNVPVDVAATLEVPLFPAARPYLVLTLRDREGRCVVEEMKMGIHVDGHDYAPQVGGLCARWMAAYEKHIEERAVKERAYREQLAEAEQVHALLLQYEQAYAAYLEAADQWAATEAKRLWEPHTLWRIRYPALVAEPIDETSEAYLETAVCMETPDDIVNQLHRSATATVTVVSPQGDVVERQIIALLDAEPMPQVAHCCHEPMAHHRWYKAVRAGVMVNVPAHVLAEPSRPPEFTSWSKFLSIRAPKLDERWEEEDPAFLLGLSPEQLAEWGWEIRE